MRKGCLVLLALFGVALFVELGQIRARDLPRPAGEVALGVPGADGR